MSQAKPKISEDATLVNESGRVIDIQQIDDGNALVDDSSRLKDTQEVELARLENAIKQGHFQVITDSKLTDVKGIGESTAPLIEAKTGCETPSELASAYLTDPDTNVRDALRRVDYFNDWLLANLDNLDVDTSLAQLKVMLFLIEFGCTPNSSSVTGVTDFTTRHHNTVKGEKLHLNHLEWVEGGLWLGSASVACLARSMEAHTDLQDEAFWNEYQTVTNHERDGDHHKFTVNSEHMWVSGYMLDSLSELLSFNPSDVQAHPDGEAPILIHDEETHLIGALAPRINHD